MDEELLRRELYAANENRARIYAHLFEELKNELGRDKAMELMQKAIHKRGQEIGRKFAAFAPGDFEGLKEAFLGGIPDGGRMFLPRVLRCDGSGLEIEFYNCPLKNAWQEMGLDEAACADLCQVARVIDNGTFEGAGFSFSVSSLPEGKQDCCLLRIGRK